MTTSWSGRWVLGVAVWVLATAVVGTTGASGAAPTCATGGSQATTDIADVDADGTADVVVGVPKLAVSGLAGAGGVDLHLSAGAAQRVTASSLGLEAGVRAAFGTSISIADLDHDGCGDLAVGAPGVAGAGAVYLLRGSVSGVVGAGAVRIVAPDGQPGDRFGASVVETVRGGGGPTDLWVAAPGRTVAGQAGAGQIYHYLVPATGAPELVGTASYAGTVVTGRVAAGDRFGEVLTATNDGVLVGVPRRKVAGRATAGQVVVISQRDSRLAAEVFDQSSPGVPGAPETGDHFGASVAVAPMGSSYVVGIPGEDVGALIDAGAVDLFEHLDGVQHSLHPTVTAFTQDSPGVPGATEKGDEFGGSALVGLGYACDEPLFALVVGAPGEAIGSLKDAGSVTAFPSSRRIPCPATAYRQGTALPGKAERGDRLGATLAVIHDQTPGTGGIGNNALIGVPGEDGAVSGSGVVTGVRPLSTYGSVGGPVAGLAYGAVIASPAFNDSV